MSLCEELCCLALAQLFRLVVAIVRWIWSLNRDSLRWNKVSLQLSLYLFFCSLNFFAFCMLFYVAIVVINGYSSMIGANFFLIVVLLFTIPSFASIPLAIFYTSIDAFGLHLLSNDIIHLWGDCDWSSNECKTDTYRFSATLQQMEPYTVTYGSAVAVKVLVALSIIFLLASYIGGSILSLNYHWLIFNHGSPMMLCCITRCNGRFGYCLSCCLCCERKTRLKFNVVTLYHQTPAENVPSIMRDKKLYPGRQGWAGGGIYFATKPPLAERKANIPHRTIGKMLTAKVHLGRIKELVPGDSRKWPDFINRTTRAHHMRQYLEQEQCDSVWIHSPHPELVVYDENQVEDIKETQY